jgi:protein-S-isoprenylcysteine O-methyltransferase Ste14
VLFGYNILMMIFNWVVVVLWAVFIIYWTVSARSAKKNLDVDNPWRQSATLRMFITVGVIVLITLLYSYQWFGFDYRQRPGFTTQGTGAVLCFAGISLAIWARRHLGANWSIMPSIKEGHALVTSGPYRFVRHPIYTGMLAAIFGSALVGGAVWFLIFIVVGAMFVWRVKVEEKIMMQLFPQQYPEYKKRTKALVPFVW